MHVVHGHSLTLYSEGSPVGGVCSQDVVDADGSALVWRGQRGQQRRRVTQEHAGAHSHGVGDGGEVITSLCDKEIKDLLFKLLILNDSTVLRSVTLCV